MEITNFKEMPGNPKVAAVIDIDMGEQDGHKYPNIKVLRGKNGGYFLGLPGYLKEDDGCGNKVFGRYPEFYPWKWKEVSNQAMELLKPFLNF